MAKTTFFRFILIFVANKSAFGDSKTHNGISYSVRILSDKEIAVLSKEHSWWGQITDFFGYLTGMSL